MSTQAVDARPGPAVRTRIHHMHVYRVQPHCWCWSCPCGGGIRGRSDGAPDQLAAFVAALVHFTHQAGA